MRRRWAGLVAVALLASTACGSRWTDAERAELTARYERSSAPAEAARDTAAATGPSPLTGAGGTATGGSAGGAGAGDARRGAATAASLPCIAPSDAPGVTAEEITLGTINSVSGPIPGFGSSHIASTNAYVAYRNATGGVCGRQIRLLAVDDGADNARFRAAVGELEPKVLALVGGVAAGGDGGLDLIDRHRIPVIGSSVTPGYPGKPTYFGIRPLFPLGDVVIPKYRYLYEQGVRTAAMVWIAAAAAPQEAARHIQLMEAAGIRVVLELALPLTTLSYDSAARAVANSGADYLLFFHDQNGSAAMARSLADTGYELDFEEYIVAYGSRFVELAGSAAEGAVSWIDTLPTEDGGRNPEQAAYLKWMAQTAPGSVLDTFAAMGWVGTKALLDGLTALPGPISREALLARMRATEIYDAGGFLGPIRFGAQLNRGCMVAMTVEGGRWRRLFPAEGFSC